MYLGVLKVSSCIAKVLKSLEGIEVSPRFHAGDADHLDKAHNSSPLWRYERVLPFG